LMGMVVNGYDTAAILRNLDVHYVVVPTNQEYNPLFGALADSGNNWVSIYHDGEASIQIDISDPECAKLLAKAEAGQLKYPDPSIAALSRLMLVGLKSRNPNPSDVVNAASDAIAIKPSPLAYKIFVDFAKPTYESIPDDKKGLFVKELLNYLNQENVRLRNWENVQHSMYVMPYTILQCRTQILPTIISLNNAVGNSQATQQARQEFEQVNLQMRDMEKKWAEL
jgi:hypothetical protein